MIAIDGVLSCPIMVVISLWLTYFVMVISKLLMMIDGGPGPFNPQDKYNSPRSALGGAVCTLEELSCGDFRLCHGPSYR